MEVAKKILTTVLIGLVGLALFGLYAGKNKSFGRRFLYIQQNETQYVQGDLYHLSEVEQFKERIKETKLQENWDFSQADILIMGDSYFNTGYDSEPVPNYLQTHTTQDIFYTATSKREITPVSYLQQLNYQKSESKYFIWETSERKSVERALAMKADITPGYLTPFPSIADTGRVANITQLLFDRVDVEYFLRNNLLLKPINSWLKNLAFKWFGDINAKTPLYLHNPNMLFLDEEVRFNADKNKLITIDELADNIAQEAKLMKDNYNLTLVYLIIPNKLSIYGDLLTGESMYDNFIPKFQAALTARGIKYIDVYSAYKAARAKNPDTLLYYAGDTHYTPAGKYIVINEIINSGVGLKLTKETEIPIMRAHLECP